ncbi:MAG TPA: hypothetical protein VIK86_07945 [Candidatus Paceibacterota bacterium]
MSKQSNSQQYITVPFILIENKEGQAKVKPNTTYLYMMLKTYNTKTNIVSIRQKALLKKLKWNDNRTLKKHLQELKSMQLIEYDFTELPIHSDLQIKFTPTESYYKTLTIHMINKIQESCTINIEQTIRLFMYYYLKVNNEWGYAWVSYDDINQYARIRKSYIKSLNDEMQKNKLIEIDLGEWYENAYEDVIKERNKYNVILE